MNPLIRLNKPIAICFVALVLSSFGVPSTRAVIPPPDGGYPRGNTAEGQDALLSLTTGGFNTAVGFLALRSDTAAGFNTAIGAGTLLSNNGDQNTATGAAALLNNTTGQFNTAAGAVALLSNTAGSNNTATGHGTLFSNNGSFNTATGSGALAGNTTGGQNTAIGNSALTSNTTGNFNTSLGASAGINIVGASNVICIAHEGANVSDSTWISNVYGVMTQSVTTAPVVVSNGGQLGTIASSERFKKNIVSMEKTSEAILSLRPVTFHYKKDTKGTPQFGLIAEEVAKVNPALVLSDKEGKPYTVRYDQVNAMLLNEFLKEHKAFVEQQRKVQEQGATIAHQQKQIEALAAGLEKVSAQLAAASPSLADSR